MWKTLSLNVTWRRMTTNIKNLSDKSLDIVLEYHNSPLVCWLHTYRRRRQTLKWTFLHTSDLCDLDLVSGHTACCGVSLIEWVSEWVSEQCFTSPPTQYRLYGRRFLQVRRPKQQYQSTEGRSTKNKSNNENN